jgi:excisionase family DNA binding protein
LGIELDLTPEQVAELTGRHPSTVKQWIKDGRLAAYSLSKSATSKRPRYRITPEALAEFRKPQPVGPVVAKKRARRQQVSGDYVRHYEE